MSVQLVGGTFVSPEDAPVVQIPLDSDVIIEDCTVILAQTPRTTRQAPRPAPGSAHTSTATRL